MIININAIDKKNNQTSVSDADRKIPTHRSADNVENEVSMFPALFVDQRDGISRSASVTDDRFYLSGQIVQT